MNIDFNRLKHLSFEVEGLILLIESKTEEIVRDSIAGMIRLKIEEMLSLTAEINTGMVIEDELEIQYGISEHDVSDYQEYMESNYGKEESEDERTHGNLKDDIEGEETEDERAHGNLEDDFESEETEDERAHGNLDDDLNWMSDNADKPEEHSFDSIDDIEILSEDDEIGKDEINLTDDVFDEDVDEISDDEISDEYEFSDDEIVEYKEPSDDYEILTVEEKLARQGVKDLRKAFTVNDRYRFRRELFGNSDIEFSDTINLVSAMSSMAEMEEYFYEDLEWDKENEEVKDFINILSLYFKN